MPRIASTSSLLLVVALAASATTNDVDAWPMFMSMVPNGLTVEYNVIDIGHAEGNLLRNPFGKAFEYGRNWTKELCEADSDGDGQTNGQELGDPCCVWSVGKDSLVRSNGISNPGNKTSLADPSLWKDVDCTAVRASAAAAAAAQSTSAPAPASKSSSAATAYVAGASTLLVASMATFN